MDELRANSAYFTKVKIQIQRLLVHNMETQELDGYVMFL